jgi:hypothetical protein
LGQACLQRRRPWQPDRRRQWRSQPPGQPVRSNPARAKAPGPGRGLFLCAEHVRQFGGVSPLTNLMEVKVALQVPWIATAAWHSSSSCSWLSLPATKTSPSGFSDIWELVGRWRVSSILATANRSVAASPHSGQVPSETRMNAYSRYAAQRFTYRPSEVSAPTLHSASTGGTLPPTAD